nr:MAG TPA: hypothetical protein [Caudoviricetes sp.]
MYICVSPFLPKFYNKKRRATCPLPAANLSVFCLFPVKIFLEICRKPLT